MSETLSDFIDVAWDDHTGDPRGVAARLPGARSLLEREPAQVGAFLWLAEHLLLGHLADPDALEPWLAVAAPLVAQHPEAAPAYERARLAARLAHGEALVPGEQPAAIQVRALATAVNVAIVRGDVAGARVLLERAATLARAPGADALKALAAAFNNLATQLLDDPRDAAADALMMDAAQSARDTWREAGTWMNVERADYLLARCAAAVGDGAKAVAHARACLATCADHGADAFERFFGHEALARGLLAHGDRAAAAGELSAMRLLLAGIADDGSRAQAQSSLDQLQGLVDSAR